MRARTLALVLLLVSGFARAEAFTPVLTVTGHGSAESAPDQAMVLFTALAQDKQAAKAQSRVNKIMGDASTAIKALGVPGDSLATRGIFLHPLYNNPEPRAGEFSEPRIIGYQASNGLEVRLDEPATVGPVIDAAVRAGVNQIENISFGLKDERVLRRKALEQAAREARMHAEAIAKPMGLRLLAVEEVTEQVGGMPRPLFRGLAAPMAAEAATPVEAGQVRFEASVTVRYRIGPAAAQE